MCFSSTASFIASSGLALVGVATLKNTTHTHERFFAAIPLAFSAQQAIEGFLWLILTHGGYEDAQHVLTFFYAVFVGIIWPILVPTSIYFIEPDKKRKTYLAWVISLGVGFAIYTAVTLFFYGVTAQIANDCIFYQSPSPTGIELLLFYLIATCAGFFISSVNHFKSLGVFFVTSFVIAYYFYTLNFISVWCFFAAIISCLIYLHFKPSIALNKALAFYRVRK